MEISSSRGTEISSSRGIEISSFGRQRKNRKHFRQAGPYQRSNRHLNGYNSIRSSNENNGQYRQSTLDRWSNSWNSISNSWRGYNSSHSATSTWRSSSSAYSSQNYNSNRFVSFVFRPFNSWFLQNNSKWWCNNKVLDDYFIKKISVLKWDGYNMSYTFNILGNCLLTLVQIKKTKVQMKYLVSPADGIWWCCLINICPSFLPSKFHVLASR